MRANALFRCSDLHILPENDHSGIIFHILSRKFKHLEQKTALNPKNYRKTDGNVNLFARGKNVKILVSESLLFFRCTYNRRYCFYRRRKAGGEILCVEQ